jgi:hypothetical protein
VLENVIEKQTKIIQNQNDRIVKLEALVHLLKNSEEDNVEKLSYSLDDIEAGVNHVLDNNTATSPLDPQNVIHRTPQKRISKSKYTCIYPAGTQC